MRYLLMFMMSLLVGCGTIYTVEPISSESDTVDKKGVSYMLPNNRVKITLTGFSKAYAPGPYAHEADVCLGDEWKILSSVYEFNYQNTKEVEQEGSKEKTTVYADLPAAKNGIESATFELSAIEGRRFFVSLKTPINPFASRGGSIELNESQMLTAASAKVTDTSFDFVTGLAKSIMAPTTGGSGALAALEETQKVADGIERKCSEDASSVIGNLTTLRTTRLGLISGSERSSVELYNALKADIDAYEKSILDSFFYYTITTPKTLTVYVEPSKGWDTETNISLFDENLSATDNLKQVGTNTYVVEATDKAKDAKYALMVLSTTTGEATDTSGSKGFYYRVPGSATFTIASRNDPEPVAEDKKTNSSEDTADNQPIKYTSISQEHLSIAQLGVVRALPKRYGVLNSEITEFKLHPVLGSIQKLAMNGTGLGSEEISTLTGLIQASRAEKPDSTAIDLKAEKDLLTLENEVIELRKKNAQLKAVQP